MTTTQQNDMSPSEGDQLRALLLRHAKVASRKALRADGQIPAEEIARLQKLARLAAIHESAEPPVARKRWPLAALLGTTLLVVSFLLFARVPETEIELDLALSEVSFVLPGQQALTDVMDLSALGASGLREIRLPRAGDSGARTVSGERDLAIHLSAASDGARQGTVSLAPLLLPAETRVWIRRTEAPHQFRVSVAGSTRALRADIDGPVRIAGDADLLYFGSPRSVILRPNSETMDVDLTLPGAVAFAPQLAATDFSFFHIDDFTEPDRTLVRRVSTILSGNLYLEALNGKEHRLRPRQMLQFQYVRGEIHTLRLEQDQIVLTFRGQVRGMETGSYQIRRSLMPTYLEWLEARHGLSLLWGTTLYLVGLVAGVLRWSGIRI